MKDDVAALYPPEQRIVGRATIGGASLRRIEIAADAAPVTDLEPEQLAGDARPSVVDIACRLVSVFVPDDVLHKDSGRRRLLQR